MSLFVQACGSRDELLQAAAGTSPSGPTTGQRLQNEAGAEQQVRAVDQQKGNVGHVCLRQQSARLAAGLAGGRSPAVGLTARYPEHHTACATRQRAPLASGG